MICPETGESFFDEQLPGNRLITAIKGCGIRPYTTDNRRYR